MRERHKEGSVVLDRRIKLWNYFYWDAGKRRSKRIGTLQEYPTKTSAWKRARAIRHMLESQTTTSSTIPTVNLLVQQYRAEKMPERIDTRRAYEVWIKHYILPTWGQSAISDIQARPVELWLESLTLAPKSKVHIRGTLSILWDFAMWRGDVPTQRNPMSLVTIKGATKRKRKPRSLTVTQFQQFISHLKEPFCTMALLCVSFGLRISEALALKWGDVDWLNSRLKVERGIVCQIVDDVKTPESQKELHIAPEILNALKLWKQTTQFSANEDWIFASPVQIGRLPWSYDQVWRMYHKAAVAAGLGALGTHALRHTYRSWLDAVGTPIAVQQKLMRHSDIRTTMNIYGDVVTDEMAQASSRVAMLALNGR